MSLEFLGKPEGIKVLLDAATLALAVFGAYKGYREFQRQHRLDLDIERSRNEQLKIQNNEAARQNTDSERTNSQRHFEKFQEMRIRYYEDENIRTVLGALNDLELGVSDVSTNSKKVFMAFYEEIALMLQSELMTIDVAFYMFGFDIIRAFENDDFWKGFTSREDPFWSLFKHFYETMRSYEQRYPTQQWPVASFRF